MMIRLEENRAKKAQAKALEQGTEKQDEPEATNNTRANEKPIADVAID